jgi:heptosyltransferase-3
MSHEPRREPLGLQVSRILVINLKHIGDVLLTTPAIRAMRRAWPEATILAVVSRGSEDVLAGSPDVARVLVLDRQAGLPGQWRLVRALRRHAPEAVFQMGQGDREAVLGWLSRARHRIGYAPGRAGGWRRRLLTCAVPWNGLQHVVDTHLDLVRAVGIPAEACRPILPVPAEARARMAGRLREAGAGAPLVVVHAVSRWMFKAWPEAACAEVVRDLAARGLSVALTSGPAAVEQAAARRIRDLAGVPVIDLVGRTSLPDLAAVLAEARLFVGVDSAPMHMAAALGVPVVALFGPSGEHSWGPWGAGHRVLAAPFLCRPCGQAGCLDRKRSHCLEAIPPADVLAAADALLGAPAGTAS